MCAYICMRAHMCAFIPVLQHACGGQGIALETGSPITMWNLEIKFKWSGLAASTFIYWAILSDPLTCFFKGFVSRWGYIWGSSVAGISLWLALSSPVLVLSIKWFRQEHKVEDKGSSLQNSRRWGHSQGRGQAKTKGTSVEETILMGWWWTMARETTVPADPLGGLYSVF